MGQILKYVNRKLDCELCVINLENSWEYEISVGSLVEIPNFNLWHCFKKVLLQNFICPFIFLNYLNTECMHGRALPIILCVYVSGAAAAFWLFLV